MKTLTKLSMLTILIPFAFLAGWVLNIVKFAQLDFQEPYKAEIIRGLGIPTGIGGVVGFIKIND